MGAPHAEGPPPGYTGGFGEPTCRECHQEYELNLDGELTVEGLPEAWRPGERYELTVVLRSVEMGAAGFQASLRFEEGGRAGEAAGTVEARDGRVQVATADSVGPAIYVQQTREGSRVEDPDRVAWSFAWTAPPEGGAVAFHAAANSANRDESPFGDLVYTTERVIPPAPAP